jgi:AcrR family transcriptional regulator
MARPRRITDDEIADAARACFLELGPAASVAAIAARLGVSQAALFHREGSKERLMLRALGPGAPEVMDELEAGPHTDDPVAELVLLLGRLRAFLAEIVPRLIVLRAAGIDLGAPPVARRRAPPIELRHALAGWLERAASKRSLGGTPAVIADAILGAIEARCFNAHLGGPSHVEGHVEGNDDEHLRALVEEIAFPTSR